MIVQIIYLLLLCPIPVVDKDDYVYTLNKSELDYANKDRQHKSYAENFNVINMAFKN